MNPLDWVAQHVTSADLFIQTPLVFFPSLVMCVVLAFVLVRVVDVVGYLLYPLFHPGQPRPSRAKVVGTGFTPGTVRIVIDEQPSSASAGSSNVAGVASGEAPEQLATHPGDQAGANNGD